MFHVEQLPQEIQEKFRIYYQTLLKWQRAINLVAAQSLSEFWTRHIEDSLQLLPYIQGRRVVDLGSGAGFPGMVLAIVGSTLSFESFGLKEPLQVTCVDSDSRKMIFLGEVTRLTKTPVKIDTTRTEKLSDHFDTVVARGFAELKKLIELTYRLGGYGVFLKGKKLNEEIVKAQESFNFSYVIHPSKTSADGQIIIIDGIDPVK